MKIGAALSLFAGLLGTLACTGAMVAVAVGIVGVGAASVGSSSGMGSMAGMSSSGASTAEEPGGVVGFLIREGPTILVVSVAAVTLAFAVRRRTAALPALLGGAVLYWGMYRQDDLGLMYAAAVVGLLIWVGTYLGLRSLPRRRALREAAQ